MWNNISKNVKVSIIMETPGMPTIANTMYVYDGRGGENLSGPNLLDNYELGYTYFYDLNHNEVSHDDICAYVKIIINTETSAYNGLSNAKQAASMNFIHEAGHALMFKHPINISAYEGHNLKGGNPYAVMNTGLPTPDWPHVSSIPTEHDKSCLTAKWGIIMKNVLKIFIVSTLSTLMFTSCNNAVLQDKEEFSELEFKNLGAPNRIVFTDLDHLENYSDIIVIGSFTEDAEQKEISQYDSQLDSDILAAVI